MNICPNAYYNYKKHRKKEAIEAKEKKKSKMVEIYHQHHGTPGYRKIKAFMDAQDCKMSNTTAHKYMKELHLKSITRQKKPNYKKGPEGTIYENRLNQEFEADARNRKWCVDFTYKKLTSGKFVFNCSILDLSGRYVVASLTGPNITKELAIETLKLALDRNPDARGKVMLHCDQGSQFTSKAFEGFCKANNIERSMSHSGYPFDNSPMERFFNTLKCEYLDLFRYDSLEAVREAIDEFVDYYNNERPNAYNDDKTPFEVRYGFNRKS